MIGEIVSGRYRIVSRIGSGGAGDVYLAEDTELPRSIALKFLSTAWEEDRQQRERFLRETEALSVLDHPHICTIYEAGETDSGHLYIAMAYYQGENLRTRLAHGAFGITEAVSCAIAIADGMDKAHRKGFLHRDLKPGNVVITEDGVVKILDFGLVKSPDRTQLTETGVTMGTLAYASPEQIRGEPLDARSDIYSLGVMLYQMLTGVCPFTAPGAAATISKVLSEEPASLAVSHPDLPGPLADLVDRCIHKNRQHRPATMAEVHDTLIGVLADLSPTSAARLRAEHVEHLEPDQAAATPKRRRRIIAVAAPLLAALTVATWWIIDHREVPDPGVVVVGIEAGGDTALAAGLAEELTAQLTRAAALRPHRWVLPQSLLGDQGADTAAGYLGVHDLISGRLDDGGGSFSLLLTRRDARTLEVTSSQSWAIPDSAQVVPALAPWLARSLGLDLSDEELAGLQAPAPRSPGTWIEYLRGLGLIATAPDSARTLLEDAAKTDAEFTPARLALARCLVSQFESEGDESLVPRIESTLDPLLDDPLFKGEAYGVRGMLSRAQHDNKGRAESSRIAALQLPSNPDYRREQWLPWLEDGAEETAEAICREAVAAHPGYPGAWDDLAYVCLRTGRYQEAIEHYRRITRLAPTFHRAYINLGAIYFALEDWGRAIDSFERSYELRRRGNSAAVSNLGTLYYFTGQFAKSAAMQELALEYTQQSHTVFGNYAAALRWLPDRQDEYHQALAKARELAEADLAANPDDAGLMSYLAGYYVDVDSARVLDFATQAARNAPDDHEIVYRAAVAHEEVGQRTRALAYLASAVELGHSLREVEAEPLLAELRKDPRYALLSK